MIAVIFVKGKVQHPITLDPSFWIFDDRKINMEHLFDPTLDAPGEHDEYLRAAGKHWSREIMEGAVFPPTLKSERQFEEEPEELVETYGMYLSHFLKNANPLPEATTICFLTKDGVSHPFPLSQLEQFVFKFSHKGKPLIEDGPVHLLLKDGSNREQPIKQIIGIEIQ